MFFNELLNNLLYVVLIYAIPCLLYEFMPYIKNLVKQSKVLNESNILYEATNRIMDSVLYVNQIYVDSLKQQGKFTKEAQSEAFTLAYNEAAKIISNEAKQLIEKSNISFENWLSKKIEIAVNNAKNIKK